MWSPAGESTAADYYPGSAYVDLIGVTILASEEWDRQAGFRRVRSFDQLLAEKYGLAERLDKPLVVAEAGVAAADPSTVRTWLAEVPTTMARFPRLRGLCYFNSRQPSGAPHISVFPDWRLKNPELLFPPLAAPRPAEPSRSS